MKKYINYVLILVFIDQLTKYLVRKNLLLGESRQVTSFFQISYITNTGIAFGMFRGANTFFIVLAAVFIVIFYLYFKKHISSFNSLTKVSFVLILSGAIGNLIDRITQKNVIDFLDFHIRSHYWPSFNVADSCITIGGLLLFITLLKSDKTEINQCSLFC